ncbi:interleukin-20 receptor subunit alpha-like [Protopterus annectens]|uniref:interleukin-20 receptor subunit alpha-like n=1 Tax=Protopterus annectens TaxID=7888 RepID=UPI001CF9CC70|nr:interleukin-20 receptor subunit alpha-like [Protopterus annectens]
MPRPGYLIAPFLILLQISGVICGNQLPGPRDVHFSSWNLRNTLIWKPGEDTTKDVEYIVQYKIYGTEGWVDKTECSNTKQTSCDLSDETCEHEEQYYARVMAVMNNRSSSWVETDRFNPFIATTIGPPSVRVSSGDRSILIKLTAPKKYKRQNETKAISLVQIYPDLEYSIIILNTRNNSTRAFTLRNKTWNESSLEPNTTYCITVQSYVPELKKFGEFSERLCATTLEDHTARLMILILFGCILPAGFVVLVILGVGCFVYRYIFVSKQQQPRNLLLHHPLEFKTNCLDHENIKFITLNIEYPPWNSTNIQKGACNNLKAIKDSTGLINESCAEVLAVRHLGYTCQEIKNASLKSEATENNSICNTECSHPQNIADEDSLDYGIVLRPSEAYSIHGQEPRDSKENELSAKGNTCEVISLKTLNNIQASPINQGLQNESAKLHFSPKKWDIQMRMEPKNRPHDGNLAFEEEQQLTVVAQETNIIDWDPHSRMLHIPSLSTVTNDAYNKEDDEDSERLDSEQDSQVGLLSKVYMKQTSEEPSEDEEICLIKFKEDWGLRIQLEE